MFGVCSRHLTIFPLTLRSKVVKRSKYCHSLVCIYKHPAFHHLLRIRYFPNNIDNQYKVIYCICRHLQFCTHFQFFSVNISIRLLVSPFVLGDPFKIKVFILTYPIKIFTASFTFSRVRPTVWSGFT